MVRLLQTALDLALGPVVTPCPVCRGPRRDALEVVVIPVGEQERTCAACGGTVDFDGRSAMLLDERGVHVPVLIQLEDAIPMGLE